MTHKVWLLLDDRAGNNTQATGVANALGMPFETKKIQYTKLAKLPNLIKGASLIGITKESKGSLVGPYPDIVIAAGRKLACVAKYIKKISPKTKLIQLMYPGAIGLGAFDMVVVPNHDKVLIERKNILRIDTSPHTINQEKLSDAKDKWMEKILSMPGPYTSVFVGGSTKNKKFTEEMARELGEILKKISQDHGGTILITTSRRTGDKQEQILADIIPEPRYFYKWSDGGDNPYFGFMVNANNIIATGDSISMASESLGVGVPLYIYNPDGFMEGKHAKFIKSLYDKNIASPAIINNNFEFGKAYEKGNKIVNSADEIVAVFNKMLVNE